MNFLGLVCAAASATGLGLAIAISRFAYMGGTDGITIATVRALLLAIGIWIFCWSTGRATALPKPLRVHTIGLGLLLALMFYGNVGAVQFIPIGLTALLFFTFPPVIAMIDAVLDRQLPPPLKITAVVIAFIGILLMLGVSLNEVHPFGVGLALAASAAAACNAVWVARRMAAVDPIVLTAHMARVAAVGMIVLCALQGGPQWPVATVGWFGLFGVVALQCAGLPLYYMAISLMGALPSAMVSNIQPLVTILAAFLLFGELLTLVQLAGGAMVLIGIWLIQRANAPPRR